MLLWSYSVLHHAIFNPLSSSIITHLCSSFSFFLVSIASTSFFFFFLNDTATTEIYPLPLHDALPIFLHVPAPASMFDLQRAFRRRLMCSKHGRREDCATWASGTRETSNSDVRVAQLATMLRGDHV